MTFYFNIIWRISIFGLITGGIMKMNNLITMSLLIWFSLQATATEPALDGQYEMRLKIRNQIHSVSLKIEGQNGPALLRVYGGDITGTISIPDRSSSSLFGEAHCTKWGGFCELQFQDTANRVHYSANLPFKNYTDVFNGKPVVLIGYAFLEDGKILGTFQAIQQLVR